MDQFIIGFLGFFNTQALGEKTALLLYALSFCAIILLICHAIASYSIIRGEKRKYREKLRSSMWSEAIMTDIASKAEKTKPKTFNKMGK